MPLTSQSDVFSVMRRALANAGLRLDERLAVPSTADDSTAIRDASVAVASLRRLIEAHQALRDLEHNDHHNSQHDTDADPEALDAQIRTALVRLDPARPAPRGAPALSH